MLQSLERQSGLPLIFDPVTETLSWPDNIRVEKISRRSAADMKDFTSAPEAEPTGDPIYTVYRNLGRSDDEAAIRASGLRYDITVIPAGQFIAQRKEFFRTAGHYHIPAPGNSLAYPEIYEVISGRAYWLIQRPRAGDPTELEEIYAVEAGPGEKAVIPPGFGHLSVNAFDEPLVLANWISEAVAYDYEPYRRLRGGGYWVIEGKEADGIEFELNTNYRAVAELVKLRPRQIPELGILRSKPLYSSIKNIGALANPAQFASLFTLDRCYRRMLK